MDYKGCVHVKKPVEKTGRKNQWFKPVVSKNKSLFRKKLITGLKKLTSGFSDLAKILPKNTGLNENNQWIFHKSLAFHQSML